MSKHLATVAGKNCLLEDLEADTGCQLVAIWLDWLGQERQREGIKDGEIYRGGKSRICYWLKDEYLNNIPAIER